MIEPAHRRHVANDLDAQGATQFIPEQSEVAGVPIQFLYTVAGKIGETNVSFSVTYGVTQVVIGTTKRGAHCRTMKGDVIPGVAQYLPDRVQLLIHA